MKFLILCTELDDKKMYGLTLSSCMKCYTYHLCLGTILMTCVKNINVDIYHFFYQNISPIRL